MQRARMVSIPLLKGTKVSLCQRDWGIERSYITPAGNEICTPAPFEGLKEIRQFKVLTTVLIDLGYIS
tara:strand:+ start:539 stop:742 length:204 start_codon:yes stop_codon:yes gene_type:complete